MEVNNAIIECLVYGTDDYYDEDYWEGILDLKGLSEEEIEDKVNNYLDKFQYIDDELWDYDLDKGIESRNLIFKFDGKLYQCSYDWSSYYGYETDGECIEVEPFEMTVTKYKPIDVQND